MIYVLLKEKGTVRLVKDQGPTGARKIAMRLWQIAEEAGKGGFYLHPYDKAGIVGICSMGASHYHEKYTGWFAGEMPARYSLSEWLQSAMHKHENLAHDPVFQEAVKATFEQPDEQPQYRFSGGGAMRESIGTKVRTHLVPYELVLAAAIGLNCGEVKYDARNWEKGFALLDLTHSIERHNKAIMDGEETDEDSGLPHYVLLASSVAMLVGNMMRGIHTDDRPEPARRFETISAIAAKFMPMQEEAIERWKAEKTTGIDNT